MKLPLYITKMFFVQINKIFKIPFTAKNISISGLEYEQYCADYLNSHGYTGAKTTKASGDHGVDVIAYKRGKKYAIQCKYYSSPVGNKAIQEVYTGMALYGCNRGIVITNSTFTKQATEEAKKLGIKLIPMLEPQSKSFSAKHFFILSVMIILFVYPAQVIVVLSIVIFLALICYIIYLLCKKIMYRHSVQEDTSYITGIESQDETNEQNFENKDTQQTHYIVEENQSKDPFIYNMHKSIIQEEHTTENVKQNIDHREKPLNKPKQFTKIVKNKSKNKRLSKNELETYAKMCNAQLEHDDEMSQYNEWK